MRRCFTDPHYWKNPALRRSREKGAFFGKKSFWFGRVQAGRIFPYFGRIFRTLGRRPDGPQQKKVRLKKKGLCMFALYGQIFQGQVVTKIEQCARMSATECRDLPSCVQ